MTREANEAVAATFSHIAEAVLSQRMLFHHTKRRVCTAAVAVVAAAAVVPSYARGTTTATSPKPHHRHTPQAVAYRSEYLLLKDSSWVLFWAGIIRLAIRL
mmetsp:Transcript_29952/g.76983  ORF Transcript_29952/g.76983 Transcript_29952/m.76983 type:complete len:101 (-) Transcript_29952:259-561(-)